MTNTKTTKLGPRQQRVLAAMQRQKVWPGGFSYGGPAETDAILQSLARRGLVRRIRTTEYGYGFYEVTDAGKAFNA